ncbi:hypothetical protein C8A05DRAFT_20043 [Staphylotrichum tortipilum]|uniref:Acid phosphatase n=1 Tax=Staphylotrichum tortipilum TaxID=2831512 RepID=A0AAN6MAE6_9PEZI|nr:hypothetical protein C8A05DRAFT_20043 [Staphylotrichum longicolle]
MKVNILGAAVLARGTLAGVTSEPKPVTSRPPQSTIHPALSSIYAAAATTEPQSPVSNVASKAFDRIIQIWLENTDFNVSSGDPNMQWIASQGILLTNYFAVTHPSQPNYAAVVAGDHFGMDHDDFISFPANISTVVDLLDTKSISWDSYQEDLPYPGFAGFNFSDQTTFANDYVRKHNPLQLFSSVTNDATKAAQIKSFMNLTSDITNHKLPQWSFITPNMRHDGHDTNITFSSTWTRTFLSPHLNNPYVTTKTLIVLSFDENKSSPTPNRVSTVLLGGAIPPSLHGTTDSNLYTHYTMLSTVQANWGLPSLGKWDCDANVLALVANWTGYRNAVVDTRGLFLNVSYPGPVSNKMFTPGWWPAPATGLKCAAGRGVLPAVVATWGRGEGTYNYTNVYPYDAVAGVAVGGELADGENDNGRVGASSSSGGGGGAGPSATAASPSATASGSVGVPVRPGGLICVGVVGLVAVAVV